LTGPTRGNRSALPGRAHGAPDDQACPIPVRAQARTAGARAAEGFYAGRQAGARADEVAGELRGGEPWGGELRERGPAQPPIPSIARDSAGVASRRPMPSRMPRIRVTCSAFEVASCPRAM